MTMTTDACMDRWPTEHRRSGFQPQPGTSPGTIQFNHLGPEKSHRGVSPSLVFAIEPRGRIYEDDDRPVEENAELRSARHGESDNILDSIHILTLESEQTVLPTSAKIRPYNKPDGVHDHLGIPREGVSVVRHKTESQPPMNTTSAEPSAISRRSSAPQELNKRHSSSSVESLPPPRRPPGRPPKPPPGSGHGPHAHARLSMQGTDVGEVFSIVHPKSPSAPSVQVLKPDHPSPTSRLFSVQSTQSLHSHSRGRQPQRKESGDDLIERIKILRVEVWGLRSDLSEKRHFLREKEIAKAVADDEFMKFVRTHGLATVSAEDKSEEQKALTELFDRCEELRNEYGPMQDDCMLLENTLNIREFELQKLEGALGAQWPEAVLSQSETPSPRPSPPPSEYSESDLSQDFHPLVAEYLSKLGDVEILRERYEWHLEEKITLEEEEERRKRVNRELAEEDQVWLANYSELKTALEKELDEAEEEAERLRQHCFSLGFLDEDGEPLDFERQERQTFVADEVDAGSEISDFVKFPLLLPQPGNKEILLPSPQPPPEDNASTEEAKEHSQIDPSDRINGWLLESLRSSPLELNLLVRTFEFLFGPITEGHRWQIEVLDFWYHDGSKELAKQHARSLSEVATQSRQKTGGQPMSLPGRPSMGIEIVMRSSTPSPPERGKKLVVKVNGYGLLMPSSAVVLKEKGGGKSV